MNINSIKNIVDTSNISLGIAAAIFIIMTLIFKKVLESYYDSEEKDSNWMYTIYALIIGSFFAVVSLMSFKYVINYSSCDILTDPFCTKLNIVQN